MKTFPLRATLLRARLFRAPLLCPVAGAALAVIAASAVSAGPIDSACARSGRTAANRSLCTCIQQAADMTLGRADQRRAAKFFHDPDMAHAVWVSKKPADDAFWDRYKQFGTMAETYCKG